MEPWAYGAAVALGASVLWTMSGPQRERPLVGEASAGPVEGSALGRLEASVARDPRNEEALVRLAQGYLDARQPGLALVLIESAPASLREKIRVRHTHARALIDEGRDGEALAVERRVVDECQIPARSLAPEGCGDATLLVLALRRVDILRELVAMGIEDAQANPEESLVAYENATREARLLAEP